MRTRAFVQDDAHIFCRLDQVEDEVARFCRLLREIYADFGFAEFDVAFSTRPAVRAGSDAAWDQAEAQLAAAARAAGLDFRLQPGEGAFYGPKLEFVLSDRQGRSWQCGTIQLDFVLPGRLDAAFTAPGGAEERPVMLHHAVLGSIERFVAILLEHHEGALPFWLAPEQILLVPLADGCRDHALAVLSAFEDAGLRARLDERNESLARKVREAHEDGIPAVVVIGPREVENGTVSLRHRDRKTLEVSLDFAIRHFAERARPGSPA
jgi:threonyl-tRNA synthetase